MSEPIDTPEQILATVAYCMSDVAACHIEGCRTYGTHKEHYVAKALKALDTYYQSQMGEREAEIRKDELTKTYTQVVGDKETPSSRYSKVTRIFNIYLKKRYAELEAIKRKRGE